MLHDTGSTVDQIVIRRLGPEDSLAELTEFLHRAYASLLDMGFRFLASHQSEEITARRVAKGECFVAVHEGRIAGTVTLIPPGKKSLCAYYNRPGVGIVHQFAVEPALRRRGIGGRLMDRVEQRAAEIGAGEIALDTAEGARHLISYYEKRGYRMVDRVDWTETNYVSVVMARKLNP